MCDVLCHLDTRHSFFEPSRQACNLFMPAAEGGTSDLHGCSIFDFVPEVADQDRLRQLLTEASLKGDHVAAASCINLQLLDTLGREIAVAIFHSRFGNGSDTVEGEDLHLIGIRILESWKTRPEASADINHKHEIIDAPPTAPLQHELGQSLQLIRSDTSFDMEAFLHNNLITLAFDAGRPCFDLFHPHPAVRCRTSKKTCGTLKTLIYAANWDLFQLWVSTQVQSAHKHATNTSGEYPGNLAVNFYHPHHSKYDVLVVEKAWLNIDVPLKRLKGGIFPTTLWLQGFSRAQYVLQPLNESDEEQFDEDDLSSSVSPHDSASCVGILQAHRTLLTLEPAPQSGSETAWSSSCDGESDADRSRTLGVSAD